MTFQQKLDNIISKNNSLLCIGLDSDFGKLPKFLQSSKHPQFEFNKEIIDKTFDLVSTYKLNSAFYEARGASGIEELKMTCDYIISNHPEIGIILDAKRADIGNTNNGYVRFAFDYLRVDAITLHPYLGQEAIQPFLDKKDKGCIVLCRTSNPGASELQDLRVDNEPLYMHIAKLVKTKWNSNKNCMLVVGATYPRELAEIRKVAPDMTFLIPGIGAQGGDLKKTLAAGLNKKGRGLMIHSARGIIFASHGKDFAAAARTEAEKLNNEINSLRKQP
ncbi:MAG: orotidine-5'-phosphate decarboxylase [Candidatus Levyibacteriota bacterium]